MIFTPWVKMRGNKVIEKFLALQLPQDVEIRAKEIYARLPHSIKEAKKVSQITYFCLSEAYKSLHIIYDPKKLAQALKVSKPNDFLKDVAACGYEPVFCHYEPRDWLPSHMRAMGIQTERYNELLKMIELLFAKYPRLQEHKPQCVSAGIVHYYAKIKGYQFSLDNFSTKIGISKSIIQGMHKRVDAAHAV